MFPPITLPQPPGEACRGGCYAFEKQTVFAKSIPSQEGGPETGLGTQRLEARQSHDGLCPRARLVSFSFVAATSAPARKGRGHDRDPRLGAPPRRARIRSASAQVSGAARER